MKEKWINRCAATGILLAVIFSLVLVYFPDIIHLSAASVSYPYETELFDKTKLMTVNIQMDEEDWNEMLANATAEQYYSCDVTINGTTYKNVGIRPKGNTSLTQVASDSTTDRFSFKLEFDHYIGGQTCKGLDKLILNNMISDATYMKEYLAYEILNTLGVVTSLYCYADVSVNGETWGLYFALEGMEESFASRNYGTNYGQLYKPESLGVGGGKPEAGEEMQSLNGEEALETDEKMQPPDGEEVPKTNEGMQSWDGEAPEIDNRNEMEFPENFQRMQFPEELGQGFRGMESGSGADLAYTDDELSSYSTIFESAVFEADENDMWKVVEALKHLSSGETIEEYIDVDAMLRYIAANVFLVNDDSYFGTMVHNYYLYEENGRLTMLPWDYNLAFGGFQSNNATEAVNRPIDTVVSGTTLEARPMIGKLLEVEEYKEQYLNYLDQLISDYFENGQLEKTIASLRELIDQSVKNDPTAFFTYEEYEEAQKNLLLFCKLRAESIRGQLNGTVPSTKEEQEAEPDLLINASEITISAMGTQGGNLEKMNSMKEIETVKNFLPEQEENSELQEEQSLNQTPSDFKRNNQPGMGEQENGFGMGKRQNSNKEIRSPEEENRPAEMDLFVLAETGISAGILTGGLILLRLLRRKKYRV